VLSFPFRGLGDYMLERERRSEPPFPA
jgi:hypothetical protein